MPSLGQDLAILEHGGRLAGGQVDRLGDQQPLAFDRAGEDPLAERLVQDPLMEGVLVDDFEPLVRLGDEIAVVDLQRLRRSARGGRFVRSSGRRGGVPRASVGRLV